MRLVTVLFLMVFAVAGQTKRALIVGINEYDTHPTATLAVAGTTVVEKASQRKSGKVPRVPAVGSARGSWRNLAGAVADATNYRQILIDRFGFPAENIVSLTDKKNAQSPVQVASAQRILDSFQSHLIDEARPGDISVFVYAGHGSRMHNLGSDEPGQMDQTLVPADSEDGTSDIRDKELARLYRKAATKKILLTVIADSCHSGGISRGAGAPPVTRESPPDPHQVNDPPDVDPQTHNPYPDPAESGYVLVISSALDTEAAEEMDAEGEPRGVFSYFFQQSLKNEPPNEAIDEILARTVALMRAAGRMQVPQLEGRGRRQLSLLGTVASSVAGIRTVVQAVEDKKITLQGGVSLGLQEGCELVRNGQPNGARIKITTPPTLSAAVAELISGAPPHVGDLFVLDRWTVPQNVESRFFLPGGKLPSEEQLRSTAASIHSAAASWHWISDPTQESPDVVVRFNDDSWELERRNNSKVAPTSVGPSPSPDAWLAIFRNVTPGKLFVDFPPPKEFVEALKSKVDPGTDAVHYVEQRSAALYLLVGRLRDKEEGRYDFEYSWILSNADNRDEGKTPLPLRTDWFPASDAGSAVELQRRTLNLARLRLWLQVSVPGGGSNPFPYSLALRNQATGTTKTDGTLVEGEIYDLILTSTPERLKEATASSMPQWIYVAAIDQMGRMRVVFPRQLINSSANHLPLDGSPPEITLRAGIPIGRPFGTDTLILLTSEEEIDPAMLQVGPVRTRGARIVGAKGSVNRLLFRMQAGSRGLDDEGAPTNWGLQRLTFRSIEKTTQGQ